MKSGQLQLVNHILIAFLFLMVGCSSNYKTGRTDANARVELLEMTVAGYANSLKWGFFEELSQFRGKKSDIKFEPSDFEMGNFRIISYENLSKLLSQNGVNARVVSKLVYYQIDSGISETVFFNQDWWYDGVRNKWFLDSDNPQLKKP